MHAKWSRGDNSQWNRLSTCKKTTYRPSKASKKGGVEIAKSTSGQEQCLRDDPWPQDDSKMLLRRRKNHWESAMCRKLRYQMGVQTPKYRFLSIGLALAKLHFLSPSWLFLIGSAKSWFRIGIYGAKSTFPVYVCINAVLESFPSWKWSKSLSYRFL